MSYVQSVKKLLSDDLKGLIKHITGFEEDSPEFKKYEVSAWSEILDRYYPSVDEHRVKSNLWEFVEKFKVHGFPQKAQNLAKLAETYDQLSYFKNFSSKEVQWGLIDLLLKLSYKPTNSLEDDPPLSLNKKAVPQVETFDWTGYLREGVEKFTLPSEDGSLSEWSDDEMAVKEIIPERVPLVKVEPVTPRKLIPISKEPSPLDTRIEALRLAEKAEATLEELTDNWWWKNHSLREIPISKHKEANYCFEWEKLNNVVGQTRILNEYKVLRELINVLGIPSSCYFIQENQNGSYEVIPNISISSTSPNLFKIVIEENFCKYFPHINKLQAFCTEMVESEVPSHVPCTYRAYTVRLQKILNTYYRKLLEIERKVDAQESIATIRFLLTEIYPHLNRIEFLSKLHDEAVPSGWEERDLRSNAFRLLCVLYEELKLLKKWVFGSTDWPYQTLLILFVDSMKPSLMFLGQILSGYPSQFSADEFFLTRTGEIIVNCENVSLREFWVPILKTCSSAIVSCEFLLQLDRYTSFFNCNHDRDVLYVKLVEKLSQLLVYQSLDIKFKEESEEAGESSTNSWFANLFDGSHWDNLMKESAAPHLQLCKKSSSDWLSEVLSDVDLSTYGLHITVQSALISVIEEHMEPQGFAAEILLEELKLLDHLRALFSSLQLTSVFSTILVAKSHDNRMWNNLVFDFQDILSDSLSENYVQNFEIIIDLISCETGNLLDITDYIKLYYKTDSKIASVISEEAVSGYALIFSFLLKARIALGTLNRLIFERFEETAENCLRLQRLYSLRIWFLHSMNSLNSYFSTYTDTDFQEEIKNLCLTERKLWTIHRAHVIFIENFKYHCFLTEGHPCHEYVTELMTLCMRLKLYWQMEEKHQLADYHLDDIEEVYSRTMTNLGLSLQLYEDRLVDSNDTFSFLYDEIMNNLPASPVEELKQGASTYFLSLSEAN